MKAILTSFFVVGLLVASSANAAPRCNLKRILEQAVSENLNDRVALDEVLNVTKQTDGTYFVEFSYVGEDYRDLGAFSFEVDHKTCAVTRK